jgi:hypothetical protein
MPKFQNSNIVFRCPISLKAKMRALAEANDQHLSYFIRSACVDALHRQMPSYQPNVPTEADVERYIEEMS